ncbi:MAG TPA: hypothetical protein VL863_02735 [bacterium]|jgi:hypothetical protein|nr:hypothetical protein [bacterium]
MKKIILLLSLVASVASLKAADAPFFQASLSPDHAIYDKTTQINGICLSIWGENPQSAFALGFVNGSSGESQGFTWGIYNYADSYTGVSWGLANYSRTSFVGWQGGIFFFPCLVNISKGNFIGFQEAVVNCAQEFHGFQLGLVNYAQELRGVQIGIVNIAMNNSWFHDFPDQLATGFPIVNWSF